MGSKRRVQQPIPSARAKVGTAAIAILVLWGLYLIRLVYGVDVIAKWKGWRPQSETTYLVLSLFLTGVCSIFAWLQLRNIKTLKARGRETQGRVVRRRFDNIDTTTAAVAYPVGEREYIVQCELPDGVAVGETIAVVYDPIRPSHCAVAGVFRYARVQQQVA